VGEQYNLVYRAMASTERIFQLLDWKESVREPAQPVALPARLAGRVEFRGVSFAYGDGPLASTLEPGTWGYIPANARINQLIANADTEFLGNFYGPLAFLASDGRSVTSVLTALDVLAAARNRGVTLIPNTLADCMAPRPHVYQGPAEPLAIAGANAKALVDAAAAVSANKRPTIHPHFVDTRAVPWIENPGLPDIALKVLRVSEETGITSLIVRHNGVAGPHYHLGAADFLILSGRIGYRAGPPDGYGPGVWFYEPAGARHEATQRVSPEDLILLKLIAARPRDLVDVGDVLFIQGSLDEDYMRCWAARLHVLAELEKALAR
jgi:ABC-type multidrug transport system fused ATPase/permease subunit